MNKPSSITFNVGAPTFGVRLALTKEGEQGSRFYGATSVKRFPNWNDSSFEFSMTLATNALHKPSSNTLNVGAPTFSVAHPFRGEAFHDEGDIALPQRTPSGLKGMSYRPVSQ